MKKFTLAIIAILCLSASIGAWPWGTPSIKHPQNAIFVDVTDEIQAAVNSASDGWVIYLYPGVHTDSNVVINKAVQIAGLTGWANDVLWQAADTLAIFDNADSASFADFTFYGTSTGTTGAATMLHFRTGSSSIAFRNVFMAFNVCVFDSQASVWKDCRLFPRIYRGMILGDAGNSMGDQFSFDKCQWGYAIWEKPVLWNIPVSSAYFAPCALGGTAHMRYCNVYTDTTMEALNASIITYWGIGAIFGSNAGDSTSNGPAWSNTGTGTGSLESYGTLWYNNDSTNATLKVGDFGKVQVFGGILENHVTPVVSTAGPAVFSSNSNVASTISNITWGGFAGSYLTTDCMDFKHARLAKTTMGLADSTIQVWHNLSGKTMYIERMSFYVNAAGCSLDVREKNGAGTFVSSIADSIPLATACTTIGGVVVYACTGQYPTSTTVTDFSVAPNNTIYIKSYLTSPLAIWGDIEYVERSIP